MISEAPSFSYFDFEIVSIELSFNNSVTPNVLEFFGYFGIIGKKVERIVSSLFLGIT